MTPSSTRSKALVNRLPLLVALPYLLFTYLLFFIGPYDWPVRQWWVIYLYIPLAFGTLSLGFLLGARGTARGSGMSTAKPLFLIGGIGALLILVPTTLTYTGKLPWDLSGSLQDQREAYSAVAEQLAATAGNRGPVALARALLGPFSFCVLPLAILFWSTTTAFEKTLAVGTVLVSIDLSVLRGTTAQLADLLVISGSAFLMKIGMSARVDGLKAIFRRWKAFVVASLALALVLVALIGRTEARLGGRNIGCIGQSGVCADISSGIYGHMSETMAFGSSAVAGYFSQGYYGIALAAEKPFLSTWGVGHSPAISAIFIMLGGDEQFANRSYTFRARADGWSDETQWSSLITWLANDMGLWGALAVLMALGWLWGRVWLDATQAGDVRAAVFFCAIMMMIFYLPANNYMMASYEGYVTLSFWGLAWIFGRKRRPIVQ